MSDGFTDGPGYESGFFDDSDFEDPNDSTIDPLDKAVRDLRAHDFGTRRTAVARLERAGAHAIPHMLNAMADADKAFQDVLAGRLVRLGQDIVPELMSALDHPDAEARAVAAWVLGELEDTRAVSALIEALSDVDPAVEEAAANALEKVNNTRALEALRMWRGRNGAVE